MPTMTEPPESPQEQTAPSTAGGQSRPSRKKTLPHLSFCLNCGTATGPADNYCPHCGQENHNEVGGLRPLLSETLSELASWDSKLLRTAVPLLFRPGSLTNEYNAGRRVRYLSPLKMYLVISAVFFVVLAWRHPVDTWSKHVQVNTAPASSAAVRTSLKEATQSVKAAKAEAIENTQDDSDDAPLTPALRKAMTDAPSPGTRFEFLGTHGKHTLDNTWFMRLINKQASKAKKDKETFGQSLVQTIFDNLPKMMFVLLPVFAVLLKLTYLRSKRLYVEHLIFALHSHAFTFALLTAAVLVPHVGDTQTSVTFAVAVCMILPLYLVAAMRNVYRQGWWKTLFKFVWLSSNYVALLVCAFLLMAFIAFLIA